MDLSTHVLLEDYETLLETNEEFEDAVDLDDFELRELWSELQSRLHRLDRFMRRIERGREVDKPLLQEIEMLMEEVSDGFQEIGAMLS